MSRVAQTRTCTFPDSRFSDLSGEVELRLSTALGERTRPARVTGILAASYAKIGDCPPTKDNVEALSCGTREWLLQQAVLHLAKPGEWFETECAACGETYDISMPIAQAPRSAAGDSFPVATVETSAGLSRFECPNGRHEMRLASLAPDTDPRRELIRLCALDEADHALSYTETDIERIDAALENIAPDIADRTQTFCPMCGAENEVLIDPLTIPLVQSAHLFSDIDKIARAYGWSEPEILRLPTERRRRYATMITTSNREDVR